MKEINRAVIVGKGALGLMYGAQIQEGNPDCDLCFLMDEERKQRHAKDRVIINGKEFSFDVKTPREYEGKADLIIFATKIHGLREAAKLAGPLVDEHTTIIAVLNGISSEEILTEYYPREQIINCVAIGMDAMRDGSTLDYKNAGRLQVGAVIPEQEERLENLVRFFEKSDMPHEKCEDIMHAMWNKFMINVGINQVCMVYETTYEGAITPGPANDDMTGAMHEVVQIAEAEGISLTKEDLEKDLKILEGLNPDGYPSMRQDAMAGRYSEVDLFAGTVVRIAKKHGIPVPVNEKFLKRVHEMESAY